MLSILILILLSVLFLLSGYTELSLIDIIYCDGGGGGCGGDDSDSGSSTKQETPGNT